METTSLSEKARAAFLGAAIGDALGWPNEQNSKRMKVRSQDPMAVVRPQFEGWTRRQGASRFAAYELVVGPGEYSDDTQLMLCVARSRLRRASWLKHFSTVELPGWILYERGGGRSTKNAVTSWLEGNRPWHTSRKVADVRRYFEAGGNGVAMRILPHCVATVQSGDFTSLAHDIVADGVCTHGHPRALVGALAYGFALWSAFRQTPPLQYGSLLDTMRQGIDHWSTLPEITDVWPDWLEAAETVCAEGYRDVLWNEAVAEMAKLLEIAQDGIRKGALPVGNQILQRLGCFDKDRNGSGTISAAAAVFIASMHAADPLNGVSSVAYAEGSDTDTLGSMAGALLGIIAGRDWMGSLSSEVQDSEYISNIATKVVQGQDEGLADKIADHTTVKATRDALKRTSTPRSLALPDGRKAELVTKMDRRVISGLSEAAAYQLRAEDGQTIYVETTKAKRRPATPIGLDTDTQVGDLKAVARRKAASVTSFRLRMPVRRLAEAQAFYAEKLGFPVTRSHDAIRVGEWIVFVEAANGLVLDHSAKNRQVGTLLFEVSNIRDLYDMVRSHKVVVLRELTEHPRREYFQCADPDGNIIEIFERRDVDTAAGQTAPNGAAGDSPPPPITTHAPESNDTAVDPATRQSEPGPLSEQSPSVPKAGAKGRRRSPKAAKQSSVAQLDLLSSDSKASAPPTRP